MFIPKYSINSRLLSNIKRIAVLTEELNGKHFSETVLLTMERSARALSSFSSTSIEGNPLPLTDVKRILKNAPEHIRDTEKEVLNYNSALEYLNLVSKGGVIDVDTDLVCRIHEIVTTGLMEGYRVGKMRNEAVFVNDIRSRKPTYLPPDSKDVYILMSEIFLFIKENQSKIDPLILAGIFHKQFVIIHPFMDGNGRTARLITKALLARMGLNTFNLFSFENYYNQNVSKYFLNVGLTGNYYDLKDIVDFTSWLEYFTDGIIDELLRVKKELEKVNESFITEPPLKKEYRIILNFIEKNGTISMSQYAGMTNKARATRILDFKKLIELKKIERMGKGKNTYYRLKN